MEALFIYIGKVFLFSGVTFLYYQLSLKNKTFHHYNRFYLLGIMLVSILLPLLKVDWFTIELNDSLFLVYNKFQNVKHINTTENDFSYYQLVVGILQLVAFVFIIRMLYGIVKIYNLKKRFPKHQHNGFSFYETNLEEAPFSFFRNLFWKNSLDIHSDLGKQILKHEIVHIEQKHSWDKIFAELITAVFWFNPFFYFIKKELYLIHEYLADKKAVKKYDTKAFAQMLLANHFGGNSISVASPFLSSNLKKRLQMLQKPKTKYSYTRRILALPVVFALSFAYLVNAKNKEIKETNLAIQQIAKSMQNEENKPKFDATINYNTNEESYLTKFENTSENDVFLVEEKRVSKTEFIEFYKKHQNNKKWVVGLGDKSKNSSGLTVCSIRKVDDSKAAKKFVDILANGEKKDDFVGEKDERSQVSHNNTKNVDDVLNNFMKNSGSYSIYPNDKARNLTNDFILNMIENQQEGDSYKINNKNVEIGEFVEFYKKNKNNEGYFPMVAKMDIKGKSFRIFSIKNTSNSQNPRTILLQKIKDTISPKREFSMDQVKVFKAETSDITKIPAMERVQLPISKDNHRNISFDPNFEDGRKIEKLYINGKQVSNFDLYINGKKVDSKEFNTIAPNTIKSIKVIKDTTPNRLEIQLK